MNEGRRRALQVLILTALALAAVAAPVAYTLYEQYGRHVEPHLVIQD